MITCRDGNKYFGLKADTKPTDVNNGDEFYVIDDGGKKYMFDAENSQWVETSGGSGGGGGTGGASVLLLTSTNSTLSKTWNEINDAAPLVYIEDEGTYLPLIACYEDDGQYGCHFAAYTGSGVNVEEYYTDSADGYPSAELPK